MPYKGELLAYVIDRLTEAYEGEEIDANDPDEILTFVEQVIREAEPVY